MENKKLAIKGHETRGNEVIELIERLGGVNYYKFKGDNSTVYFFKGILKRIETSTHYNDDRFVSFTLEEFLEKYPFEKYPYKVGDKVVSSHNKELIGTIVDTIFKNDILYIVRWCNDINNIASYYCYDLQPYKEEIKAEDRLVIYADPAIDNDSKTDITIDGERLIAPNGYTIGNATRNSNKLIVEYIKNKPQYPKTYNECCNVLIINPKSNDAQGYKADDIICFQELLIARDAYWKIAGEEMGLSEPWKPNLTDVKQDKYAITNRYNKIQFELYGTYNGVLVFPTKEMRDAFLENFKDLIEQCKEFL